MYRNNVSLIGFTGKDAQTGTTNAKKKPYTILSLATKSSYKDKGTGEYIDSTEWHHIVAWGKLGEFAAKIQKGAHLAVDGELSSREVTHKKHKDVKYRLWQIRATSILKLDRAEKAAPEEQAGENLDAEPADDEVPA